VRRLGGLTSRIVEVSTFNFFYGISGVGATMSSAQETTASIGLTDKPMTVEEVIASIRVCVSVRLPLNGFQKAFKHILVQSRNLDRLPSTCLFPHAALTVS
jgi:hypothetical protein